MPVPGTHAPGGDTVAEPGQHRIVVTGLGAVSPVGNSAPDSWASIRAGRGGITRITHFDPGILPVRIAGEVKGFDAVARFGAKEARRGTPHVLYAMAAAREAVADARSRHRDAVTRGGSPHRIGHRRARGPRAGNSNARQPGGPPRLALRRGDGTRRHGAGDGRDRPRRPRPEHGGCERVRVGSGRDRPGRQLDQAG